MSKEDGMNYEKARRQLHQVANELRKKKGEKEKPYVKGEPPYCSFCGKGKNEYRCIVEGPSVYICDKCTKDAQEVVDEFLSKQ